MIIKDKTIVSFKNKLKLSGIKGLALDIDDTLADTSIVWLERVAVVLGNPEQLTMREMSKKYGYGRHVDYWVEEEYERVTLEFKHSNEFFENIPLIENANKHVETISKIVPIIAYITARPKQVLDGTEKWLNKHKFPKLGMINRPEGISSEEQFEWKARVLEQMYPQVLGIIDDSVGIVNELSKDYKGIVFLYKDIEEVRNDIRVVVCKDWDDVLKKVKENKEFFKRVK